MQGKGPGEIGRLAKRHKNMVRLGKLLVFLVIMLQNYIKAMNPDSFEPISASKSWWHHEVDKGVFLVRDCSCAFDIGLHSEDLLSWVAEGKAEAKGSG